MMNHQLSVSGMSCGHCVQAITEHVSSVPGVTDVHVDLDKKTVTVAGGEATAIVSAIDDAGFDID